jgi:D-glycero-D-manno-heptose 1,7-bisphosphate phosphatase
VKRAVFLDRDGTLIEDTGYGRDPNDVVLLPGVAEGLAVAKALGFLLVVVSNQSGVARGIITPAALDAVQTRFEALLAEKSVVLDHVEMCLHAPDEGCACRKPAPGMLLAAAQKRGIDLARSVMIGDRDTDIAAGRAAGCTTILIGKGEADHNAESFTDVAGVLRALGG